MLTVSGPVTTLLDVVDSQDGLYSLREAIVDANLGSDVDTIQFAPGLTGTIVLGGTQLPTITQPLSIQGSGAEMLIVSGNQLSRVFQINAGAEVTIKDLTITGGKVTGGNSGGGIYSAGTLHLDHVNVISNEAGTWGGGLYSLAGASVTIHASTFDDNKAVHGGGARIHTAGSGEMWVRNSTFSNNTADNGSGGGSGGGLYIWGGSTPATVEITNSTFSGNDAGQYTGGVRAQNGGTILIVNSTITDNYAGQWEGGISAYGTSSILIHNSILADNDDGDANTSYDDGGGIIHGDSSHNLVGVTTNAALKDSGDNNIVIGTAAPGLAPLGDYGGPTQTQALLADSPAINAGSDVQGIAAGLLKDQRGADRSIGPVDIGAFEAGLPTTTPAASNWQMLVKDNNAGFGLGWDLVAADRLVFDVDAQTPVRWVRADGFLVDFTGYDVTSPLDASASTVSESDPNFYIRRDKHGNVSYYSKTVSNQGALVKSVDRQGVGYEYVYGDYDGDFQAFELDSMMMVRPGQVGETTTFQYTGSRITAVVDPFGRTANLAYDGNNRLHTIQLPAPDPAAPTVRPTFTFTYDSLGFLSSITDADGRTTAFDFSPSNELTITYADGGARRLLPTLGNVFGEWRAQLGGWQVVLPEFKYEAVLDGSPTKSGYEIDPLGRPTTFELDGNGHLVEVQDPAGNTTEYVRNSAGLPTEKTVYASGSGAIVNQTTYTYDSKFNLERLDYFDGTFETWEYDATFSRVTEHVDQLGRVTLYDVDPADGNVLETRIVVGLDDRQSSEHDDVVTQFEYEADGLIAAVVRLRSDVDGGAQLSLVTEYAYTDVDNGGPTHIGRWLESTTYGGDDPLIAGLSLVNAATIVVAARNAFGVPTQVNDELNRQTQYVYDDLDRLTKVTSPVPGFGQLQPTTEYVWSLSGLLADEILSHVGAGPTDRITTHHEYDPVGRLAGVLRDFNGTQEAPTTYEYDLVGNVVGVTDALGHTTTVVYNVLDLPIAVQAPDPDDTGPLTSPLTLYAYDALDRLIATRDAAEALTRLERDELGRVVAELRPLGATTAYEHDDAGQLLSVTDPLGRTTVYTYDGAGRLATMFEPGYASAVVYAYDSAGNLRLVTNPVGAVAETVYDERRRVVEQIDENGDSTLYEYTNANELQLLTDPRGNETIWAYDGAGRVQSETNELGHARTYTYDAYSRLAEKVDRNGRLTTYEYDTLHQLSAENWYDGVDLLRTISYDFDKVGNLEYLSDPDATYDFEYDNLNRETDVTQTIAGLTPTIRFDHDYDAASRMTSSAAMISGVADYANSYSYDALGRLETLTQAGQGGHAVAEKRVDFTYNTASQLTGIMRYASTTTADPVAVTEYGYDPQGRLASIDHTATGSTFAESHSYTYDGANRMASYTSLLDDYVAEYGYDARGQLTNVLYTGGSMGPVESYDYDNNGNRDLVTNSAGAAQDYSTGSNNRLLSDGVYDYVYDNEGNLIRQTSIATGEYTDYTWDYRNRLTSVTEFDAEDVAVRGVNYSYDALNQLVVRAESFFDGSNEKSVFVHDEGQIVMEFHEELLGSLPVGDLEANDLARRMLWGPAVDQLLTEERVEDLFTTVDNETLWALTDHLGSVRDLVDSNGTLRLRRDFDSFGNIVDETTFDAQGQELQPGWFGFETLKFAYTGRPLDETTGLQNNLHRWYDASVGRWLSEDPLGFAAGDANLYRYVGNAPTIWVDPSGLEPEEPPEETSEFWGFINGFGQGVANVLNAGTEVVIGTANLPATGWNYTAGWFLPNAPYIPNPDWSKGFITNEGDVDGDGSRGTHGWSKGFGHVGIAAGAGALGAARGGPLHPRATQGPPTSKPPYGGVGSNPNNPVIIRYPPSNNPIQRPGIGPITKPPVDPPDYYPPGFFNPN